MESAGEQFFENTPFHAVTEMLSVACAYRNLIFAVLSGTKPVNALEGRSGLTTS